MWNQSGSFFCACQTKMQAYCNLKKSRKPALGTIKKDPDVSVVSNEQDKLNDEAVEDTTENTLVN